MNYQTMVIFILPFITIINMLLHYKHLLMTLLTLEAITLSMVIFIMNANTTMSVSIPLSSVLMLTMGACEASLGLALLVLMSRFYGNDLVKSLSMSKC